MSWVKVDDKAWSHPKFLDLPASAVRLWLFGLCWSNDQETDGLVSRSCLRVLGGNSKTADLLVSAGLWVSTDSGWQIRNFLKYQPSKAEKDAKRASQAERVRRHRGTVSVQDVTALHPNYTTGSNTTPDPTRPDPTREKEISPPRDSGHRHNPPSQPAPLPRIAASVAFSDPTPGPGATTTQTAPSVAHGASNPIPRGFGGDPRKRPDVLELHQLWQTTFAMPPTKFRGGHSDQSAETLALAIDACGLDACKLALKHAATEPGVKGELDGSGNVHSSIRYLFGNEDTLPRLLKHAEDRERRVKPAKMTKGEALLKLASLPPDSEEAVRLRDKLKRAEEREQSSWQPSSVMGSGLR